MGALDRLAEFELDVLKEIGNIGTGNAATALSQLLGKPVDMDVPRVSLVPFEQIADRVGGTEQVVVAVFLRVEGEAPGNLFFILGQHSASSILSQLLAIESSGDGQYTDMQFSALCEIGNILAGSYISSLADFTNLSMTPSVPFAALDMAGAILTYGLSDYGEMGDSALLIETAFFDGKEAVNGHFFLIPDPDSFAKIFLALGVPLP